MTYEAWRIGYQSSEQAARAAYAECERLQAKVDAMERQEPIGVLHVGSCYGEELEDWEFEADQGVCDLLNERHVSNPTSLKLYALPVAHTAPSVPELLESLRCACNYIDKLGGVSQQYRAVLAAPEAKP